jgi:hypothetical protein
MEINQALTEFYKKSGFELETGKKPAFVDVFVGCLLIPLPNIETRRKYIKYHDLHHIVTGFGATHIGEGEVSAWELGTGSWVHPMLLIMNLIAVSTALVLQPRRVFQAYLLGGRSKNLYCTTMRKRMTNGELHTIEQLKAECLNCRQDQWQFLKTILFGLFAVLAMVIHVVLILPALLYKKVYGRYFPAPLVKTVKIRG